MAKICREITNLVSDPNVLMIPFTNVHPHFKEIMQSCVDVAYSVSAKEDERNNALVKINRMLIFLHDYLNIGKWSDVPEFYRKAFTAASFIKAILLLYENGTTDECQIKNALEIVDKGFLLGLPLDNLTHLLTQTAEMLNKSLKLEEQSEHLINLTTKRIKIDPTITNNKSIAIPSVTDLSLEAFSKEYFFPMKPVVIQGNMKHWPALTKWADINYLLQHVGERTVPIEIGASYSSEKFSQRLMTVREFVKNFLSPSEPQEIGYLAQHDLLAQVPQLGEDVRTPEYCCISRDLGEEASEPHINAWFGPKGTVSSLHYDPRDNFLCQVFGAKQVFMFAPKDEQYLYCHDGMLSNTSKVDPTHPDFGKFPLFSKCTMFSCILQSGDMLYIPLRWWHHVISLERSFSVNFWWK